jgi:Holliday junction resolvase
MPALQSQMDKPLMSIHRRNARRDKNEPEIKAALETVGAKVYPVSAEGLPDTIVIHRGVVYLVEIKTDKGKLTPAQEKFFEENADVETIGVVRSDMEALRLIGAV